MASKSDTTEHSHLITGFLQGNWECFEALVLKCYDSVFAYTLRYTKSKALTEDILDEACRTIWEQRGELDNELDFYLFLKSEINKLIVDHIQKVGKSRKLREDLLKKIRKAASSQAQQRAVNSNKIKSFRNRNHQSKLRYKLTTAQ